MLKIKINKNQESLITIFFIWLISLPGITLPIKIILDQWYITKNVSVFCAMFGGLIGFCLIWNVIEKIKPEKTWEN